MFYIVNLRFADVVWEKYLARLLVHGYMYIYVWKKKRDDELFLFLAEGLGGRVRGWERISRLIRFDISVGLGIGGGALFGEREGGGEERGGRSWRENIFISHPSQQLLGMGWK